LYCMTEVREVMRSVEFLASMVMSSSVMPSAKVLLPGIAGKIVEGEHGEGADCGLRAPMKQPIHQRSRAECDGKKKDGEYGQRSDDEPEHLTRALRLPCGRGGCRIRRLDNRNGPRA